MSVTPDQLIDCAEAILNSASDEAHYRAVCSRAYYAAFQAADAYHNSMPVPGTVVNANGRHEQLISQLSNPMCSKKNKRYYISQALGKSLRPLVAARVIADYHINENVDVALAKTIAADARVLIANAK